MSPPETGTAKARIVNHRIGPLPRQAIPFYESSVLRFRQPFTTRFVGGRGFTLSRAWSTRGKKGDRKSEEKRKEVEAR